MKVSRCCGASLSHLDNEGETGLCDKCKDWSGVEEEDYKPFPEHEDLPKTHFKLGKFRKGRSDLGGHHNYKQLRT